MITELFKIALVTSLAGGALTLIISAAHPFTKRRFSAGWNYYVWLAVIFVMLCPMRISLPERVKTTVTQPSHAVTQTADNADNTIASTVAADTQTAPVRTARTNAVNTLRTTAADKLDLLAYIWLITAAVLLGMKLISYAAFRRRLKISSRIIDLPEIAQYTKRRVTVRRSGSIISPLIVGVFRPALLLPDTELTDEQLKYVLLHEAMHLNRSDILYKWLVTIVKCVHWFNPAVYVIAARVNAECEISCDLSVASGLTRGEETAYARTILALLSNGKRGVPLTTGMTGGKRILRRRFEMIRNKRNIGKRTRIVSAALAGVMTASAALAGGVLADGVLGDNGGDGNVIKYEIYNGDTLIETTHKPLIHNHEYYLPLRETLNGFGYADIAYENGVATVTVPDDETVVPVSVGTESDYFRFFSFDATQKEPFTSITLGGQEIFASNNGPIIVDDVMYAPIESFDVIMRYYSSLADFRLNVIKPTDPESYYKDGEEVVIGTAEEQDKYTNENPGKKVKRIITDSSGKVALVIPVENQLWETREALFTSGGHGASNFAQVFEGAVYFKNFLGKHCILQNEWEISSDPGNEEDFVAMIARSDWVTFPENDTNKDMQKVITNTYDETYGEPPFSDAEVAAAKAVVEEYWRAKAAHDRDALLATTTLEDSPNLMLFGDETIMVNDIRYDPYDINRENYIKYGGGSVNGTAYEDVIVFRVDFTVSFPEESTNHGAWSEGEYTDWNMLLIRDGKDGKWLIDDQGY